MHLLERGGDRVGDHGVHRLRAQQREAVVRPLAGGASVSPVEERCQPLLRGVGVGLQQRTDEEVLDDADEVRQPSAPRARPRAPSAAAPPLPPSRASAWCPPRTPRARAQAPHPPPAARGRGCRARRIMRRARRCTARGSRHPSPAAGRFVPRPCPPRTRGAPAPIPPSSSPCLGRRAPIQSTQWACHEKPCLVSRWVLLYC